MADGVSKGAYPYIFGHSGQLSLNKFFEPSTPSMRKGRDGGEKNVEKTEKKKKKRLIKIVATTSLPVVDSPNDTARTTPPTRYCPNDDRWNAARSCQLKFFLRVGVGRWVPGSKGN